ncbi:MAG: RNA polymerase sigma factor [Thermoleophilia bacterium]
MATASATIPGIDAESRQWLADLRSEGGPRERAVARLHDLLVGAARFEVARRRRALPGAPGDELDDIAREAAADAVMSVLRRLDDYRGLSRFTTWAYKFALLEAAVALRRRAWREREVVMDPARWEMLPVAGGDPHGDVARSQLMRAIARAVDGALTPRQREVLVALTIRGEPIDVLAERLGATRGAVYKALHDARRRLRAELAAQGLDPSACGGAG